GYLDVKEPFAGLFTQGMVCHETYQDAGGNWLFPEEVRHDDAGHAVDVHGRPVAVGRTEKMSKSRKNVVGLETIVEAYGADTARLYLLSDSPPERDLEWTDAGIEGAWRYANRLWRLVAERDNPLPPPGTAFPAKLASADQDLRRVTHQTAALVTDDLDKFRFNRAVARIRELTNAIEAKPSADAVVVREALEAAVRLIGPMMPHLAEALWQALGHQRLLADEPWPKADAALAIAETVTLAVQVNGKLRGTIEVPRDVGENDARQAALALPNVITALAGKTPRKTIVVPNRIVNVVV
ncbi:MAG: class I tRNA ligase family protein, partial [Stellaceae bacterium]